MKRGLIDGWLKKEGEEKERVETRWVRRGGLWRRVWVNKERFGKWVRMGWALLFYTISSFFGPRLKSGPLPPSKMTQFMFSLTELNLVAACESNHPLTAPLF